MRQVLAICAVAALCAIGLVPDGDSWAGGRLQVRVPDVENMTPDRAYAVARQRGLRVAIDEGFSEASNYSALVLRQSPRPGRRVRGGSVLRFREVGIGGLGSFGGQSRSGTVPDVVGLSVPEAARRISKEGLNWQARLSPLPATRRPRLYDNYRVVEQEPSAGADWDSGRPVVVRASPLDRTRRRLRAG